MMRSCSFALTVVVFSLAAATPSAPQKGIEPADLNTKINPCTDFYEYANGGWREQNPIPSFMDRWSRRWQSGEKNKDNLKSVVEETAQRTDWPKGSAEQLMGDFYAACMDEARVNAAGSKPIEPLLAEIDSIQDAAGVERTIRRFHDWGITVPFGVTGSPDNHDPTRVLADVYASGLGLPDRDYYTKSEKRFVEARAEYAKLIQKMFELIGTSPADAHAAAETVFAFEKKLALAQLDNVALRDPNATDHKTTFAELQKMAKHFDWQAYFDAARMPKDALNVQQPKFLKEVDKELSKTSLPVWRTYLKWHLVRTSADALSDPFEQASFDFYGRYLSGAKEMKPRWKRCVETTDELLGEALGRKYVERYFSPQAKARMQAMVSNILLAMRDSIGSLDWMGPDTKKKALEKLSTFNPKIGYPDKWKDYKGVVVDRSSYFDSVVAASKWNVDDDRSTVGKPVDRGRWGMTPPTSNAYYSALMNEIVFPAGILQPPAFDEGSTDAVNYGAIGVVIGHEISHGFDDQGAKFDAQGKLNNWWTEADLREFQARGTCVADQFEGYFIEPGIHHNGRLVLGESIGDLAGAKLAFLAYKKSREGKGPEPTIDGFTPEQQFFLAWGQWRGDATRPETQRRMVQGDPHPVAKYRVNGPLSNLTEFREAFACKADDPMVRPEGKRCTVW